ncbi:MAG: HD domain-containing protein [Actinobacteria bacterium]|jgi:HD-GYP domain-containing protein (c-di-GMP phosphodiesterase class II)|nr:MAG: HD domain-containing protein [Actinomycetota bacterium]
MDKRVMALASLGLAGAVGVILFLTLAGDQPVFWFSVVLLGVLVVICESLGESMTSGGRSTYGIIALFAAIAALNTPSAMIVALFGAFHLRLFRHRDDPWELAFNAALYAICTWAAAAVYHALGGASRAFTLSNSLKSLLPLLVAAAVFWALNTLAMAAALRWQKGVEPVDFLKSDAFRLLPNQIIYALVGLAMGVIYAQNAFHEVLDPQGNMVLDALGNPIILGSIAESLRGLFAVLSLTAVLGVAWYFSGKNIELLEAYDRSIEVLVTHLERREPYLDGHAVRVAGYTALIARQMRFPLYEVNRLRHAALLHDLGRPAIPLDVLLQPSALSEEEFEKVKMHPLEGGSRLEEVEYLSDMAEAVRHHHEYYDGGGYIDHLSGDTIPLSARIIAVVDAYDSMMNRRPWREAKGPQRALAELRENSGRQFDPEIVEHFIAAMEEVGRREGEAAIMAQEAAAYQQPIPELREEKGGRRRTKRREEMLRERREARERLEREAIRSLEEPGAGDTGYPQAENGGEVPGGAGEPQGDSPEGGGEAQ